MTETQREYDKPLPAITELNAPFWEGTREGELRLQACSACGHTWFPPAPFCPRCLSADFRWTAVSGRGRVWSWIVMHQRYFKSFEADLPYKIIMVELDEGPLITGALADTAAEIRCDMPVRVTFEAATEEMSIPKFVPA
jgi:uncharacterized OB-fold protein